MSIAVVSSVFTGGSWDLRELHASEIQAGAFQGPIPAHLLEQFEEEAPVQFVRKAPPKLAPFAGMTDEERREKARKGGLAAHAKRQPAEPDAGGSAPVDGSVPCIHCGEASVRHGRSRHKRRVRRCTSCRRSFTWPQRPILHVPCPDCGSRTKKRGGAAGGGHWRQCLTCSRRFRTAPLPPKPERPPCKRCSGRTVRDGKTKAGKQLLICTACETRFTWPPRERGRRP